MVKYFFLVLISICCLQFNLSVSASDRHQRIVSTHLCTDQFALLLADHNSIVSLSYFSHDADMSVLADLATRFPVNHGLAEEIVQLNPDLILTVKFGSPQVYILRRLGYEVVEIPIATSVQDIRENVMRFANAIGKSQRGERLIENFDKRLQAVPVGHYETKPLLAIFRPNGFTSGKGTLISQVIEYAGFRNLASELGYASATRLPLELLIMNRPDLLLINNESESPALAHELPNHPAIQSTLGSVPKLNVPGKFWNCGTTFVADAFDMLVNIRKQILEQHN